MTGSFPTQIIVIDDAFQFAVHLWRYLAEVPGFGMRDDHGEGATSPVEAKPGVGADGPSQDDRRRKDALGIFWARTRSSSSLSPTSLAAPKGDAVVWWAEGRGVRWKHDVQEIRASILEQYSDQDPSFFFVVDIRGAADRRTRRGPRGNGQPTGSRPALERYDVRAVVDWLERRCQAALWEPGIDGEGGTGNILLVSSYWRRASIAADEKMRLAAVYSKTGSTFQRILVEKVLRRQAGELPRWQPEAGHHILVTGAGFELSSKDPGENPGMPSTPRLIASALNGGALGPAATLPKKGYPVPDKYKKRGSRSLRLRKAARDQDLDSYWDELLRLEMEEILSQKEPDRRAGKRDALHNEFVLRENFRSALVRYDWGHLPQSTAAVRLPFEAWLTTNYSRFANRAIDLCQGDRDRAKDLKAWRVVATSNEAKRLRQELLHEEGHLLQRRPGEAKGSSLPRASRRRYLFKLHGDIPHVTTMALAGHDKEISNPLSVPIDSLHDVYSVAERWIEELLRKPPGGAPVYWHVVGHALWDVPLNHLLHRVCRAHLGRPHVFLLVGPYHPKMEDLKPTDPEPAWIRLANALPRKSEGMPSGSFRILCLTATARSYMARLTLPPSEATAMSEENDSEALSWLKRSSLLANGGGPLRWQKAAPLLGDTDPEAPDLEIAWHQLT